MADGPMQKSGRARVSLGEALDGHRNSLGLLRLILASAVIFHHSYPLIGVADPFLALSDGRAAIGSVAVAGFFAISGYLIAKSGTNSNIFQFLWRRSLRIFPAFWTVLLLTALVIGPALWLMSGRTLPGYFVEDGEGPLYYLRANWKLSIGTYGIHDLLATNTPYGLATGNSVFNGSLWTLWFEFVCYLIIGALLVLGLLRRARFAVPLLAIGIVGAKVVHIVFPGALAPVPFLNDGNFLDLSFTFLIGATLAMYSKVVPFDNRLGVLSGVVLVASIALGGYSTLGIIAGAYFVLYLGARFPRRVQWVGQKNDYSYGVYIYGFLVQQVMAGFGLWKLGYWPFSLIALVITFGCAYASWHIIEKNAMRLKDSGPGSSDFPQRIAARFRGISARARR